MEVIDLINICQKNDNTYKDIYLSNEYNFDKDMPAFFLAYKDDKLVGFLSNYADEIDDVEISLLVHPKYRKQGIATELSKFFEKETEQYNLQEIYFQTEERFISENKDLPDKWNLKIYYDTDLILVRDREKYEIEINPLWQVKKAEISDVESIADFQSKSFNMPKKISKKYASEAISGEKSDIYILIEDDIVIASCSIDYSYKYNYLFGFATLEEKRGRGAGSYLIKSLINKLIDTNSEKFQIIVEDKNIGARKLYERLGFEKQSTIVYLVKK